MPRNTTQAYPDISVREGAIPHGRPVEFSGVHPDADAGYNRLAIQAALSLGGLLTLYTPGTYPIDTDVFSYPADTVLVVGPGVSFSVSGVVTAPASLKSIMRQAPGPSKYIAAAYYGDQRACPALIDASGNQRHALPTSRVTMAETWAAARAATTVDDTTAPYKAFWLARALLDLDLATHSIVFNLAVAKAAPGATHYLAGNSAPGSSRGFLLQALSSGALRLTVRDNGNNQQNSTDAAATVDGTLHFATFAVAREISNVSSVDGRYCWTYADGALAGGVPKHLQNVTQHTLAASDKDFGVALVPTQTNSRAMSLYALEILKFDRDSARVNIAGIAAAFYTYGRTLGVLRDDELIL